MGTVLIHDEDDHSDEEKVRSRAWILFSSEGPIKILVFFEKARFELSTTKRIDLIGGRTTPFATDCFRLSLPLMYASNRSHDLK